MDGWLWRFSWIEPTVHIHRYGNSIWGCSNYVWTPCHRWTGPQPRNAPCVTHMLQVPFCPSSLSSLPLSPLLAAHSFLTELMFVRSARKTLLWEPRDMALSTSIPVDERYPGQRLREPRRWRRANIVHEDEDQLEERTKVNEDERDIAEYQLKGWALETCWRTADVYAFMGNLTANPRIFYGSISLCFRPSLEKKTLNVLRRCLAQKRNEKSRVWITILSYFPQTREIF